MADSRELPMMRTKKRAFERTRADRYRGRRAV